MTIGIVLVACWAALVAPPPHRHDDVHLQTDQVGHESGVPIKLALGPSGFDGDVLTLHMAQLAEALAEGLETTLSSRIGVEPRV
jgi:hypothetical protein